LLGDRGDVDARRRLAKLVKRVGAHAAVRVRDERLLLVAALLHQRALGVMRLLQRAAHFLSRSSHTPPSPSEPRSTRSWHCRDWSGHLFLV
jgi:hypothetical protein